MLYLNESFGYLQQKGNQEIAPVVAPILQTYCGSREGPILLLSQRVYNERYYTPVMYSCLHYAIFVIRNALLNVSTHVNVRL